jgi:hypothetical protein
MFTVKTTLLIYFLAALTGITVGVSSPIAPEKKGVVINSSIDDYSKYLADHVSAMEDEIKPALGLQLRDPVPYSECAITSCEDGGSVCERCIGTKCCSKCEDSSGCVQLDFSCRTPWPTWPCYH